MRDTIRLLALCALLLVPGVATADHLQDGLDAYDIGDYEKALEICLPHAEAGDRTGQFCVGRMYANGFGVPMDDALALKWYGLAAEQGHPEAQFNLGVMYANGWGVPVDDVQAVKLYRLAAEQGLVIAQTSLANVCHAGRGVDQNIIDAYKWYAIAAALGDLNAEYKRDSVAAELSAEDLATAKALAQEWLDAHEGEVLQAGRID